jgi:hypothetical protein
MCLVRAQLKRLISGREPAVAADAAHAPTQLRVPEFESPHRDSPIVTSGLGVHSPHPMGRGEDRDEDRDSRWAPAEETTDEELDAEVFSDSPRRSHRNGSVSSGGESPDLLEGLSDTSSSDGEGGGGQHRLDAWMARDRAAADMDRSDDWHSAGEQPAVPQEQASTRSSEPNLGPLLAARKEQHARLRVMQSHAGDISSGTRFPELSHQGTRRSAERRQAQDSGGSLEDLMRLHPSASMRVQPSSSWAGSSPLLQKLKEISAATEGVDEEEDKRQFFARLDASTGLGVIRGPSQPTSLPEAETCDPLSSDGSRHEDTSLAAYLNPATVAPPGAESETEPTPVWKLAFSADSAALVVAQPSNAVADSLELPRSIVLQQNTLVEEPSASVSVTSTLSGSMPGSASLHDMLAAAREELDEKARDVSSGSSGSPPSGGNDKQEEARNRVLQLQQRASQQGAAAARSCGAEAKGTKEEVEEEQDFEPVRASTPTPVSPGSAKPSSLGGPEDAGATTVQSPARGVWEKSHTEAWRQVPPSPDPPAMETANLRQAQQRQELQHLPATPGSSSSPARSSDSTLSRRQGSPHAMLKSRLPVRSPRRSPTAKTGQQQSDAKAQDAESDSGSDDDTRLGPATGSRPPRSPARSTGAPAQRRSPARRVAAAEEKVEMLQKQLAAAEATKKVLRAELSMRHSREGGGSHEPSGGDISESDGEIATILKERVLEGGTLDGVTRGEMRSMERLVSEQETMICAYQKENEKTCRDLRDARARVLELETLLEEYATGNVAVTGPTGAAIGNGTGTGGAGTAVSPGRQQVDDADAMQALRLQLQQVQREANERELELKHELDRLRQGKRLADAKFAGIDVPALQREGERLHEVQHELDLASQKHKEEVAALHKQLAWYVENQEIIDKSDKLVAAQKEKIEQLEAELEQAQGKGRGKGGKTSGRAASTKGTGISTRTDSARIKELEAQVGTLKAELEEVLRKKHPNSIPQLIRAARPPMEEHAAHAYMSTKIKTLESTLEEKEEEHAKRLRVLRQGFERVKAQHEQRLAQLEVELETKTKKLELSEKPHLRVKELERQLDDTRSFYTKKLRELNGKLATAPKGRHAKSDKSEKADKTGAEKSAAAQLRQKCRRLEADLSKACAEIRRLQEQSAEDAAKINQQVAAMGADHIARDSGPDELRGTPSPPRGTATTDRMDNAMLQNGQETPPPTNATKIEMAMRQSVTDQSPLFDAPLPPSSGRNGNVQHSPPHHKTHVSHVDPSHPLQGMDVVQSLLGELQHCSRTQTVQPEQMVTYCKLTFDAACV